jgi:hypothetical protein
MRASLALVAGFVALSATAPAHGALLDQPPRLYNFRLDDPASPSLPLLDPFRDAADPVTSLRRHLAGPYGQWRLPPLRWQLDPEPQADPEPAPPHAVLRFDDEDGGAALFGLSPAAPRELTIEAESAPAWVTRLAQLPPLVPTTGLSFKSNGFDALWALPPRKVIPNWRCRRRPVRIARYGGESDAFALVRCDGSAATEAYDRLTILARESFAPRPGELLPDEPAPEALSRGEWTPGVRLVHPRLLWALQRLADAFPWRTIYIYSGSRHAPEGRVARPGTHHSMHSEARALDITVMGIPNHALIQECRKLPDVGCGFYPNNHFIHLDVRRAGSGHPLWIDVSAPGEPSRYVDAWPGVVEGGALVWDATAKRGEPSHAVGGRPGAEASCTKRGP